MSAPIIHDLAKVYATEEAALDLLSRAEVPQERVVPFGKLTPLQWWQWVDREVTKGLTDGLSGIVAAAAEEYGSNPAFREWRQVEAQPTAYLTEPIDVFVGRDAELAELHTRLTPGGPAVALTPAPYRVSAHGGGGIGKTRLARHYGHLHRDDYPGGVLFTVVDDQAPLDVWADLGRVSGTSFRSWHTVPGSQRTPSVIR
jgi:hypothetical protein